MVYCSQVKSRTFIVPDYKVNDIEIALSILKQGGLVCYPTDTVYGMGGGAFIPQAARQIYLVKGRTQDKALPLLIADISSLNYLAAEIPREAQALIKEFWPGALTIVLHKSRVVPAEVCPGTTVAIRMPRHEVPLWLIRHLEMPLIGTSANLSGYPVCLTADEVRAQLGGRVDWVIDRGRCPGGKESTVVDLSTNKPRIIREGAIPYQCIKSVIGPVDLGPE